MPDDPLQQRSPSSTSIPSNGNEPRFRNLLDDSPSVASLPIASTSRPTLEQLTRDVRGDQRYALIHPVGKQDTFASVALAYGCSVRVCPERPTVTLIELTFGTTANCASTIQQTLAVRSHPFAFRTHHPS